MVGVRKLEKYSFSFLSTTVVTNFIFVGAPYMYSRTAPVVVSTLIAFAVFVASAQTILSGKNIKIFLRAGLSLMNSVRGSLAETSPIRRSPVS